MQKQFLIKISGLLALLSASILLSCPTCIGYPQGNETPYLVHDDDEYEAEEIENIESESSTETERYKPTEDSNEALHGLPPDEQ